MSHTLSQSGVFMGEPLNESGDLIPPEKMYEACRVLAHKVIWKGGLEWDFSEATSSRPTPAFKRFVRSYLQTVLRSRKRERGWKIPETTLVFPWIVKMFPDARYIYWVRNPLDCILGAHVTDDLHDFGVDYPATEDEIERRAYSWIYQYKLVKAVPKPKHWIEIRFEDFVLKQEKTLKRLENFLGFPLAKIPVNGDAVDRWKREENPPRFEFLKLPMREYGYEGPWGGEG